MNEDNPGRKYVKGDNSMEIVSCAGWGILCDWLIGLVLIPVHCLITYLQ